MFDQSSIKAGDLKKNRRTPCGFQSAVPLSSKAAAEGDWERIFGFKKLKHTGEKRNQKRGVCLAQAAAFGYGVQVSKRTLGGRNHERVYSVNKQLEKQEATMLQGNA